MSFPAATNGLGVPAQIKVPGNGTAVSTVPGRNSVFLSLSGTTYPTSFQLNPEILDAAGNPVPAAAPLALTAVAASSGGVAVYTGTITGGASNALVGKPVNVAGFAGANNNGSFIITASSATALTLDNAAATAETHAATATPEEAANALTYKNCGAASFTGSTSPISGSIAKVVNVSSTGLLTTNGVKGKTSVEVSFPVFNNGFGTGADALPKHKIYADITVHVVV